MKIDKRRFCGLSRSKSFQYFLRENFPDLFTELINHLQKGKGCSANKAKMVEIYNKISDLKMLDKLFEFLQSEHSNMLIHENDQMAVNVEDTKRNPDRKRSRQNPYIAFQARNEFDLFDKLNIHKVFDIFRPGVFLIPQRMIFFDESKEGCINQIINFKRNKVDVDYIVLKGPKFWHGYIEYFEQQYAEESKKVNKIDRPICKYKKRYNFTE